MKTFNQLLEISTQHLSAYQKKNLSVGEAFNLYVEFAKREARKLPNYNEQIFNGFASLFRTTARRKEEENLTEIEVVLFLRAAHDFYFRFPDEISSSYKYDQYQNTGRYIQV